MDGVKVLAKVQVHLWSNVHLLDKYSIGDKHD